MSYKITIGNFKSVDELKKALKDKGIKISTWADDVMNQPAFVLEPKEQQIEVVVKTVAELGFSQGATNEQIFNKAKKLGLELCPPETMPQLLLQVHIKDWVICGMKPIVDSDGDPRVFSLYWRGNQLILHGNNAKPSNEWNSNDKFVFMCNKKNKATKVLERTMTLKNLDPKTLKKQLVKAYKLRDKGHELLLKADQKIDEIFRKIIK